MGCLLETALTMGSNDAMTVVIDGMGEKYGGVEGYVRDQLGFSSDDIAKIRANLTGQ